MKESTGKVIGWLLGVATGVACICASGFMLAVIGVVIGAMSICTEPVASWAPLYDLLALLLLPVIGVWTGCSVGRAFIHRVASSG